MPVTNIPLQPAASSLVAAYRPVVFKVEATPTQGSGYPPFVVCDVYINFLYYKSFVRTAPEEKSATGNAVYVFDIQDALQEYLQPDIAAVDNDQILQAPHMSAGVVCRFRSSGKDADGFTVEEGPKPVQGTRFTQPQSGGGTESNAFFAINAALQHEDNQDLAQHLNAYKQGTWDEKAYPLTHRNRYYVCDESSDHFPFIYSGNCLDVQICMHYRMRNSTVWQNTCGDATGNCATLAYEVTVVGNTVKVELTQSLAPGESYLVRYKLQADSVWVNRPYSTSISQSFAVEEAGDYDIQVIRFCSCCGSSDPVPDMFSIGQQAPQLGWRGINPFCETNYIDGAIYLGLELRGGTEEDTWFPNSTAPVSRTRRIKRNLYVKFFSDAQHLTPLDVQQNGLQVWVKKKTNSVQDNVYFTEQEGLLSYAVNAAGTEHLLGEVDEEMNYTGYQGDPTAPTSFQLNQCTYALFPDGLLHGGNTGRQGFATLQQYSLATGNPTGVTKPNAENDPDYIEPINNALACPVGMPYTNVNYGAKLDVRTVEFTYYPASFGAPFASTPAVSNTGAGNYTYIISAERDKQVQVTVRVFTGDSGNTTGLVQVHLTYEGGTSEDFSVQNGRERTLPPRKNIKTVTISNY